jgi:hypothetical protein
MPWFLNHYVCEDCGCEWEDEWSATCDDDCPECGSRHMEVSDSIDLTEVIRVDDANGGFLVLRSLDSAEEKPEYRILAKFPTREEAEKFLEACNSQPE